MKVILPLLLAFFCATDALGQAYPTKPVKIIVPNAAGGATDLVGRLYASRLTAALGQSFFVENRPGAGATIGAAAVAKAPADGYTLLLATAATHGISPGTYPNPQYDADRDFAEIGMLGLTPMAFAARPELKVGTIQELVARSKKESIDVAQGNVMGLLTRELLVRNTGAALNSISYKGTAGAVNDVLGGRVPVIVDTTSAIQPLVSAGKLVALGVTSTAQSPLMPGVKTVAEQGVPGFEVGGWFMLMAPHGTPANVVNALNAELKKIAGDQEFQKQLVATGIDPAPVGEPPALREFVHREYERWVRIAREMKLTPE